MQRRSYLKTISGIGAAATIGGIGVLSANSASAAGGFNLENPVTVSSNDGSVEYVAIYGDSVVSWTGFDTTAQYFDIAIDVAVLDSDGNELHSQEIHSTGAVDLDNENWGGDNEALSGAGTGGTIESAIGLDAQGSHDPTTDWHIVGTDPDGYGLPSAPVPASHLSADDDGTTDSFTLEMTSSYTWYDSEDTELYSEAFVSQIPVEVENIAESASTSDASGDDGALGA